MTDHQEQLATGNESPISTEITLELDSLRNVDLDKETLSRIFAEVKEKISSQQDATIRLEQKADKMISYVSVVAGITIAGLQFILKNDLSQILGKKSAMFFYIGGASFFLTSVCLAFFAYKVEHYRADPNPSRLAERYLFYTHDELLRQLIDNLADSYKVNERVIERKAKLVRLSVFCFNVGLMMAFSFLVFLLASRR